MVDGEIPADVVLRTDRVLAFRDINPQAPTHVLVIPQEHHRNLGALAAADPALLGEVAKARTPSPSRRDWSPTAAASPATASSPTPVPQAGQSVDHLHLHVLGRPGSGAGPPADADDRVGTVTEQPHRPSAIERDGDVAVVVLDNPPLNLFTPAVFQALDAAGRRAGRADRSAAARPRAGGAVRGPRQGRVRRRRRHLLPRHRRGTGADRPGRRAVGAAAPRRPGRRGPARCPRSSPRTGSPSPRPSSSACAATSCWPPSRRQFGLVEIVVGLTPSMGGPQRLAERAGPARATRADLHRRALPGRRARAVERRQPGAARRGLRRGRPRLRPPGGRRPARSRTRRPSSWSPRPSARAPAPPTQLVPAVSGALFATEDLRGAVASFLTEGPGKATYTGR